jgi:hypothetical protein
VEPVTPVLPHSQPLEIIVAESQPEFTTLPSFRTAYTNLSRWRLTPEERLYIMSGGDLFIAQLTGNGPPQPILPIAISEDQVLEHVLGMEKGLGLE